MSDALTYTLTDNGIEYKQNGYKIRIKGKSASKADVAILSGNGFVPTETGNLNSSTFRGKLVAQAQGRLGDAEGLISSSEKERAGTS